MSSASMSASATDIDATDPVLVLTVDPPSSIRCVGKLDGQIAHCLVEAVAQMLEAQPRTIGIDIGNLLLADSAGADALLQVERQAKQAGTTVRWHGVGADHLRRAPDLGYRASPRAA